LRPREGPERAEELLRRPGLCPSSEGFEGRGCPLAERVEGARRDPEGGLRSTLHAAEEKEELTSAGEMGAPAVFRPRVPPADKPRSGTPYQARLVGCAGPRLVRGRHTRLLIRAASLVLRRSEVGHVELRWDAAVAATRPHHLRVSAVEHRQH